MAKNFWQDHNPNVIPDHRAAAAYKTRRGLGKEEIPKTTNSFPESFQFIKNFFGQKPMKPKIFRRKYTGKTPSWGLRTSSIKQEISP